MKDISMRQDITSNQARINKTPNVTSNQVEEMEQCRTQFEKSKSFVDGAWNSSVLRVLFKNESFARKYKAKIEKFLKDLLDEGEEFDVYPSVHTNDEQEHEDNQAFHIDRVNSEHSGETKIPVYSSTYEDTLNCNDDKKEETIVKAKDKAPGMTCFNCLGDHHMKNCPEKMDRARINANKKELLLGNTVRYHNDDKNSGFNPGTPSDKLREALGLRRNQLPLYIYNMRVIGYPPGWMNEAIFERSGLSLFDSDGRAVRDENLVVSPHKGTLYDSAKFIEFPGFNTPVPQGFIDEWKKFRLPPLQPHQQLSAALKSPNIVNSNSLYKRKQNRKDDVDSKKHKTGAEEPSSPMSKANVSSNNIASPGPSDFKTPDSKQSNKRHSMSLSMSPGTPVLGQGNPYHKLPDSDKFAQGITEHLPFENLPDAVGTFEKMRGIISCVQKKLTDIKNS